MESTARTASWCHTARLIGPVTLASRTIGILGLASGWEAIESPGLTGSYGSADRPSDSGIPGHRHPWLGKWMGGDRVSGVRPADRALLGSNPSAVVDSNTAGLGSLGCPGRPPAGSTGKR